MRPFSAPAGTLIPKHAHRFRFGPSDSVSKLLKLFKLLRQCPNTDNQSNRTIISLSAVTHYLSPQTTKNQNCKIGAATSYCGWKKAALMRQLWLSPRLLWSQKAGSIFGIT